METLYNSLYSKLVKFYDAADFEAGFRPLAENWFSGPVEACNAISCDPNGEQDGEYSSRKPSIKELVGFVAEAVENGRSVYGRMYGAGLTPEGGPTKSWVEIKGVKGGVYAAFNAIPPAFRVRTEKPSYN